MRTRAIATLLLIGATAALASPTDLDPSFGVGGKVVTPLTVGIFSVAGAALQPDGNLVVAGSVGQTFVARYLPDGTLDASFGSGGLASAPAASEARATAMALRPDGRIVVLGTAPTVISPTETGLGWMLTQFAADGSLDATFGTGGVVTLPLPPTNELPTAVVVLPDGNLVAAGNVVTDASASSYALQLRRFLPDGSLDATFGTGGTVTTSFGASDTAAAMVRQPDGAIAVAGATRLPPTGNPLLSVVEQVQLLRFLADGSLDATFGVGGRVVTAFDGFATSRGGALALQPDGALVVGGTATFLVLDNPYYSLELFWYEPRLALARYLPNGNLDPGFGSGGTVTARLGTTGRTDRAHYTFHEGATASRLAIQADGAILAGGVYGNSSHFGIARFHADGSFDPTFGACGTATTGFGDGGIRNTDVTGNPLAGLLIQADGRLLAAAGTSVQSPAFGWAFGVARYSGSAMACQPATSRRASISLRKAFPTVRTPFLFSEGKFSWRWVGSVPGGLTDLGDPTTTSDVTACLIDASGSTPFVVEVEASAGQTCGTAPCWKSRASGFSYADGFGAPDGVGKAKLRVSRAGVGSMSFQGPARTDFVPHYVGPDLPLVPPLTLRIKRSDGPQCWQATFSTVKPNTATKVAAHSD